MPDVPIPPGGTTSAANLKFKAKLDHFFGKQVRLEVEIQPLELNWNGDPSKPIFAQSAFFSPGSTAEVTVPTPPVNRYKWRCRNKDIDGVASGWTEFPATGVDFEVVSPVTPAPPMAPLTPVTPVAPLTPVSPVTLSGFLGRSMDGGVTWDQPIAAATGVLNDVIPDATDPLFNSWWTFGADGSGNPVLYHTTDNWTSISQLTVPLPPVNEILSAVHPAEDPDFLYLGTLSGAFAYRISTQTIVGGAAVGPVYSMRQISRHGVAAIVGGTRAPDGERIDSDNLLQFLVFNLGTGALSQTFISTFPIFSKGLEFDPVPGRLLVGAQVIGQPMLTGGAADLWLVTVGDFTNDGVGFVPDIGLLEEKLQWGSPPSVLFPGWRGLVHAEAFLPDDTAVSAGDGGAIGHSTDSSLALWGLTHGPLNPSSVDVSEDFLGMRFDGFNGFACMRDGFVFRSLDGGFSWAAVNLFAGRKLRNTNTKGKKVFVVGRTP